MLALVARRGQARGNAGRGGLVMLAIALGLDELGLVDDAVDVAMLARELEEGFERAAFAVDRVAWRLELRRDAVADLRRHVAHERLEHRLLAVEVGVEGAERDAGALGDADDRAVGKAALAELVARGIEDLAQGAFAARRARRLAVAGRGWFAPR